MSLISEDNHKELFEGPSLLLGKMFWYMIKSEFELNSRCHVKVDDFSVPITTELGKEVGLDSIHWWVFKRENSHSDLLKRTTSALEAAQKLKDDYSPFVKEKFILSYPKLITAIKEFTLLHDKEIGLLYDYVKYLYAKNELAPAILFSYRVWGSSRRAEKIITINEKTPEENLEVLKKCTQMALGLASIYGFTVSDAKLQIMDEVSLYIEGDHPTHVSNDQVIYKAMQLILHKIHTFLELIRDSFRNIMIEISKYGEQTNLLSDNNFLKKFIEKAKMGVECELWDFKETLEMWHARNKAKEEAEVDFCEQIASYANLRGGVLVIGVTDNTREIVGVDEIEDKIKFTANVIARYIPNGSFVMFGTVKIMDNTQREKTCLVIGIPQTKNVISINHDGRYSYPIRRGTGLEREDPLKIMEAKKNAVQDNYDFLLEIEQFVNKA